MIGWLFPGQGYKVGMGLDFRESSEKQKVF